MERMNKGWWARSLAIAALSVPVAASAQDQGRIELSAVGRHTWMSSDRPLDNGIGIGGALGIYLTQRIRLSVLASYTPTELTANGSSAGYVPINIRLGYELPVSTGLRVFAASGWVLNRYPDDGSDDTGIGSAGGLKIRLSEKIWLLTQVTHDWMPPWLNEKTFIITNPPSRNILITHGSDVHMGLEAGLSARFGGGRDQPVVATAPPTPTPTSVQEPPRQQTPPPQQTAPPQQQTQTPPPQPAPAPRPVETAAERYVTLDPVYFDFDKSAIRPDAREILLRAVAILRANPDAVIVLEGHTDERGSNDYNDALGRRRAQSVFSFLSSQGIESNRLQTVSMGEQQPADPAKTQDAFARNRRVMLTVQGNTRLRDPGR
jgi:peptidoglycan-associated lipoprotein